MILSLNEDAKKYDRFGLLSSLVPPPLPHRTIDFICTPLSADAATTTISSPFFSEVPASFAELGSFYKRANIMHKDFLTHFVCQHQISIILPWHAIKFVQSAHNHFYMAIPPDHKRLGLERLNIWAGLSHHFWSSFSCDDFPLDCPTCQLSRSLLSSCHLTWEPWDKGTGWPSI